MKITKKEIKQALYWINHSGAVATTNPKLNIILNKINTVINQIDENLTQKEIIKFVYQDLK